MAHRKRLTRAALSLAMPAALAAAPALLAAPAQAQTSAADLRILSPRAGDTLETGSFALDVSFKSRSNAVITTAELWVDGTRWVRRDLDTPQIKNVLSFDVDASTLREGIHTFVIRVFDANGGASEKSVSLQMVGANRTPAEDTTLGPEMKFVNPLNDKHVSGIVELQLDAKPRNGANPYVTFYVDKQFKTLKNYPPYSFAWDTTTVDNGYHTIEAMGYLDASNASTTRRLRVYVDNPGGNTTIKSDIPDLSKARQQAPVSAVSAAARPMTIPIRKSVATTARSAASLVASGLGAVNSDIVPDLGHEARTLAKRTKAALAPVTLNAVPSTATVAPRPAKPASIARKTATAVFATSDAVKSTVAHLVTPSASVASVSGQSLPRIVNAPATVVGEVVRPEIAPRLSREMTAVKRVMAGVSVAAPAAPRLMAIPNATARVSVAHPPQALVPVNLPKTTKATPRAILRPQFTTLDSVMKMSVKPLQVAFDGRQIAFDVQPRVEKGLPIAPFRQIFEHTGGQVMWIKQTHTVRAVNTDREVVIPVGSREAKVNGERVTMDRKATIERGRTIVPLSFVKDALDVNVRYDPTTGHLDITSKN